MRDPIELCRSRGWKVARIKDGRVLAPFTCGCYALFSANPDGIARTVYVGKSTAIATRLKQHGWSVNPAGEMVTPFGDIPHPVVMTIETPTESDAYRIERDTITDLSPAANIVNNGAEGRRIALSPEEYAHVMKWRIDGKRVRHPRRTKPADRPDAAVPIPSQPPVSPNAKMSTADVNALIAAIGRIAERLDAIESILLNGHGAPSPTDDLMSLTEVAAFLRLSKTAIYRAVQERRIPSYKPTGGKMRLFKRADVLAYATSTKRATTGELETRAAARVIQMNAGR